MLRSVVGVVMLIAACGGDDEARPDAPTGPVYDYDFSCLNVAPASVPSPLHIRGWVADMAKDGADWPIFVNATMKVQSPDGTNDFAASRQVIAARRTSRR